MGTQVQCLAGTGNGVEPSGCHRELRVFLTNISVPFWEKVRSATEPVATRVVFVRYHRERLLHHLVAQMLLVEDSPNCSCRFVPVPRDPNDVTSSPVPVPEPGGSARCSWNGYGGRLWWLEILEGPRFESSRQNLPEMATFWTRFISDTANASPPMIR